MVIYKPIYVVGYPHGGCTLPCNMLRESEVIYTVVGTKTNRGSSHAGRKGFEGHNSLYKDIPETLRNPAGKGGQCWNYAWDKNIDKNYLTEKDVRPEDKKQYLDVLEDIKKEFKVTDEMRFLDKSQPYLVKTRYVQEMLSPADVYFLYIIRNPHILCYKSAKYSMYGGKERSWKAIEQVTNTYNCFVGDSKYLKHHMIVRFEDFILDTRETLKKVCSFLDLNFDEDMMPRQHSNIESSLSKKFYPLKKNVIYDDGYGRFGNEEMNGLIGDKCADIIKRLGYSAPETSVK